MKAREAIGETTVAAYEEMVRIGEYSFIPNLDEEVGDNPALVHLCGHGTITMAEWITSPDCDFVSKESFYGLAADIAKIPCGPCGRNWTRDIPTLSLDIPGWSELD